MPLDKSAEFPRKTGRKTGRPWRKAVISCHILYNPFIVPWDYQRPSLGSQKSAVAAVVQKCPEGASTASFTLHFGSWRRRKKAPVFFVFNQQSQSLDLSATLSSSLSSQSHHNLPYLTFIQPPNGGNPKICNQKRRGWTQQSAPGALWRFLQLRRNFLHFLIIFVVVCPSLSHFVVVLEFFGPHIPNAEASCSWRKSKKNPRSARVCRLPFAHGALPGESMR